jgi:hypothetical protein
MKRLITICLAVVLFGTGNAMAGIWTTLDYPEASATVAYGISGSSIVGEYIDGSGNSRGLLYNGSTWTTLDYPGSNCTETLGISGSNIVGVYFDAPGSDSHGFIYTIPEPATLLLLGLGGLAIMRRRRAY